MKVGYVKQTFKYPLSKQLELLEPICDLVHIQPINNESYKQDVVDKLASGDTFVVSRFIVVSESLQELLQLLKQLEKQGVIFQSVEQEYNSSTDIPLSQLLSLQTQLLEDIRYQRHMMGIIKAKAKGIRFGRPRKLSQNKLLKAISLKELGFTSLEVANRFHVSKSTLLRNIVEYREAG